MRDRAAQESDILHSGKANIGDILAAPAHQAVVLFARQTRADSLLNQDSPLQECFSSGWHPRPGLTSSTWSQQREVSRPPRA
jgi:hypothetical protein